MKLLIDTREKDEVLVGAVIQECEERGIEYELTTLKVGDFLWDLDDTQVCIEHKSIDDLYASKRSGHLDTQMLDIKQYPNYILLIDGKWKFGKQQYGRPIYPEIRDGILLSVCLRDRVPYHHVNNSTELSRCIMKIADIAVDGDRIDAVERHSKTRNRSDPNLAMFLQIPGLGEKRALALMKKFGSFGWFIAQIEMKGIDSVMVTNHLKKSELPKGSRDFLHRLCTKEEKV